MPEETPGQKLSRLIKQHFPGRRANHTGKSQFARAIGKSYQTVDNWCNDKSFGPEQQEEAALGLGLARDAFSAPPGKEDLRERYRSLVLAEFREHEYGRTLTQDEWRSIETFRWPERVTPRVEDYWGLALVMHGKLSPQELEASVHKVRRAAAQVAAEMPSNRGDSPRTAKKKPPRRRKAHSMPRK